MTPVARPTRLRRRVRAATWGSGSGTLLGATSRRPSSEQPVIVELVSLEWTIGLSGLPSGVFRRTFD